LINIEVGARLRIAGLSPEWVEGLAKLVSVKNEDKDTAVREHIYGAQHLDDLLTLAEYKDDVLSLPRGFLHELIEVLKEADVDYDLEDATTRVIENKFRTNKVPDLKEEQTEALRATTRCSQGRIIAPPGKGKTIMGLSTIRAYGQKSIILVEKKHIAQQWVDRAKEHFDIDMGFIGDNKWEEQDVTVALIQTLWSRRRDLDKEHWWDKWGLLELDEQHHIPAETYTQVVERFPAKYRYGFSATIGKSEAKKRISELVFGPILYETTEVEVKPKITIVNTGFDFNYHPTHKTRVKGKIKVIRNNYKDLIKALVNDPDRNMVVANMILKNEDHANLIVSNRISQLEAISGLCTNNGFDPKRVWMLTGKENLERRMEIYELADEGSCAIFSTLGVAGEALDIPILDRIHTPFPIKNEETYWQVIGRGIRPHKNKQDAIIFDYVDSVDVLKNQGRHRLQTIYQPKQLEVEVYKWS
jgi:superfamily II DNA or RNA helicase